MVDRTAATTDVVDTIDDTTVRLSATDQITEAGGTITYTATLDKASEGETQVTLSNGETITIADGETTGTVDVAVAADEDVYLDDSTIEATITGATGGNFENIVINNTAATTDVVDTIDPVNITIDAIATTPKVIDINTELDGTTGIKVTAFDSFGKEADLSVISGTDHDGFGVQSRDKNGKDTNLSNGATKELGFDEKIVVEFNNDVNSLDVSYAWRNNHETSLVTFYDNGTVVGSATVDGNGSSITEAFVKYFDAEGNKIKTVAARGSSDKVDEAFTFELPDSDGNIIAFDKVEFTAPEKVDDYLIHEIVYTEAVDTNITDILTEGGGLTFNIQLDENNPPKSSASAKVEIDGKEYIVPLNATGRGTISLTEDQIKDIEDLSNIKLEVIEVTGGGYEKVNTASRIFDFSFDALTGSDDLISTDEDTSYTLTSNDFGDYIALNETEFKITDLPDAQSGVIYYIETKATTTTNNAGQVVEIAEIKHAVTSEEVISLANINEGKLVFEPTADSDVDGSFKFQVGDGNGNFSEEYTTSIEVVAVADTPDVDIDVTKIESSTSSSDLIVKAGDATYNITDIISSEKTKNYTEVSGIENSEETSAQNVIVNENLNQNDHLKTTSTGETASNIIVINGNVESNSKIESMDGNDVVAILGDLKSGTGASATLNDSNGTDILYFGNVSSYYDVSNLTDHIKNNSGTGMDGAIIQIDDSGNTVGKLYINNIEGIVFSDGKTLGNVTLESSATETVEYEVDFSAAITDYDADAGRDISETLSINITGVPSGATLSGATQNIDGSWTVTLDENAIDFDGSLTLTVPVGAEDFTLKATATATETNLGSSDETVTTLSASNFASAAVIMPEDNTAPTIGDDSIAVSEEGINLPGEGKVGIPDEQSGTGYSDTTNSNTASGSLAITGNGTAELVVAIDLNSLPTDLTSGNDPITWTYDSSNQAVAIGSTADGEVIRVELNDGDPVVNTEGSNPPSSIGYEVTLTGPVDHSVNSLEDTLDFDFDVSITDGNNTPIDTGSIAVTIEDDMPSAQPDKLTLDVAVNNLEIGNLKTSWSNVSGGSANIDNQPAGSDDVVSWGDTNQNTNYTFDDNNDLISTQSASVNSMFELGEFTHNNFPVSTGIDSVDLDLSLNVNINGYPVSISHTINFDHNETTNSDDLLASRDIVTIQNASTTVPVTTPDGQTYEFEIIGFVDGSGNLVDQVYTNEDASNSYTLMAKLVSSDSAEIIGAIDTDVFGADGPAEDNPVEWQGVDESGQVQGQYGVLTVQSDGSYIYAMDQEAYDQLQPGTSVDEEFTYTIIDGDGDGSTSTLTIDINPSLAEQAPDRQPEAESESQEMTFGDVSTNLVLTLDVSGSMGSGVSGTNQTRFEIAKASLVEVIQSYQSLGNTDVNLTLFGKDAANIGWMNASDAIDYIESLELYNSGLYSDRYKVSVNTNGTDYKDAIDDTEVISFNGHNADQTIGYFLSDGEPNENQDKVDNDNDQTIKDWKSFIEANVDELHVVGIGSNVSDEYLEHVQVEDGKDPIIVTDENQLANTLNDTVQAVVTGDVSDNYSGGDGVITIDSIEVYGTTYTASNFPSGGVDLDGQGTLQFNFTTGQYSYSAASNEFSSDVSKAFSVAVSDADGDTASFNVNIDVTELDTTASTPNLDGESLVASESVSSTQTVQTVSDEGETTLRGGIFSTESKTYSLGDDALSFSLEVSNFEDNGWWDSNGSGYIQILDGATVVDTITLNGNGSYDYTAPVGSNFDAVKVIRTGGNFKVSDFSAEVTQTVNTYSYELDLSASLTDTDSETLSDVTVSDLPNGVTVTGTGVTYNGDGTFTVELTGGVAASDVKLESTSQLTQAALDAITISVTATETTTGHENTVTAKLVDGIVEGLAYVTTSGVSGLTDANGSFSYVEGDTVTFMVGDVVIGTADENDLAAGQVFLQDLANVGRSDLNNEYVENMAVFLQSLDADGNADNGITITPEVFAQFEGVSLDLKTASEADVKAVIESAGHNYVNEEDAMAHVQRMLQQYGGQTEFDAHIDDSIKTATLAHETLDVEGLRYETSSGMNGDMVNGIFEFDQGDTIELFIADTLVASFNSELVNANGLITFDAAGFTITADELSELLAPEDAENVSDDIDEAATDTQASEGANESDAELIAEVEEPTEEQPSLAENDYLDGGENDDTLIGGDGADVLFGQGEVDTLSGGTGDDYLSGGVDNLTSGEDSDTLVVDSAGSAVNTLEDFNSAEDVLDVSDLLDVPDGTDDIQDYLDKHLLVTDNSVDVVKSENDTEKVADLGDESTVSSGGTVNVIYNDTEYTINVDG
ncbi:choice-of-anchor K domain-containing protein [Marinomonas sp. E8]|uniref:Choice-of-anchor K domain-containing protein n=1 Tax=Marinomonas algarum TaxID=2883105 RepID=A0A9X1LFN6_9GAMM|nr:choice-of-anchor K domain-containing protein [Marinomonas algarum]